MMIPAALHRHVKSMQIIAAALMMGLAIFLAIVGFIDPPVAPGPGRVPVLTYLGLFLLASMVAASFVVPAVATRAPLEKALAEGAAATAAGAPPEGVIGKLLAVRTTALILGLAPVEGAGFFNAIAYLVERDPIALGAALGALVVMATRFPTFASVAGWLQRQQDAMAARRGRGQLSPGR